MSGFDVAALLEPIAGDDPAGFDARGSEDPNNLYRQIRDARSDARRLEQDADLQGEISAEAMQLWKQVRDQSREYIAGSAKDLEIAAYLVEALIRIDGFSGLTEGAAMLQGLAEQYWGELYPRPDLEYDEGVEATLLPIARLDLEYAIRRLPITDDTSIGALLVWQHGQALQLEQYDADERQTRIDQGAISSEMFDRASAETTAEFFQQTKAELDSAQVALTQLSELLDEKAGADSPNFSSAFNALSDADAALRMVAGSKLDVPEPEDAQDGEDTEAGGESGGGGGARKQQGEIQSREDAFKLLEKVALWFERAEPQSILPAEISKAVRRGRMNPAELYADLISDESVREQLYRDVGIEARSESDYNESY